MYELEGKWNEVIKNCEDDLAEINALKANLDNTLDDLLNGKFNGELDAPEYLTKLLEYSTTIVRFSDIASKKRVDIVTLEEQKQEYIECQKAKEEAFNAKVKAGQVTPTRPA